MGWSNYEEQNEKKGMETSSKVLLAIIACVVLIIILTSVLLLNIELNTYTLSIDGITDENYDFNKLVSKLDNITYINIEEFSKLVGYEYHKGEYKAFTIEEDKCYVQGKEETASFFLNDNKICKLPVNELNSDYREFTTENTVREINGKMYATIDTINLAFNVVVGEREKSLEIYTLNYLVKLYDSNVKKWGYTGIADQSLENQKSLLYGYLIVKKDGGLYKIIDTDNIKEIVSDRYNSIQFNEVTKEFFVTNSLNQVGIINIDGTTKIEPVYESISLLDKDSNLYLIKKYEKYGVVKSGNITIIPAEYDGIGCNVTTVEVAGNKKSVEPVLLIERCNGIVVKKADKYGIIDLTGKELVPIAAESIYAIEGTKDEDSRYFMLYNGTELNVIERLIAVGLIEDTTSDKNTNETITNSTTIY